MKHTTTILLTLAATALAQEPRLTSFYTTDTGQYARIYQTVAAETAGTKSTTWSRGAGVQTLPTYAGVHEISHSANYVYIRTTGLGSHMMGPWYLNAAKSTNFPNFPSNTTKIFRIPRTPVIPPTKTNTPGGATGYFVNGVALFDMRDTFSYSNSNATDASPTAGIGLGDGIWNREAYHNEGVTFDAALAHQAGNQYHYHAQAVALRAQLGDHVDYNATTNRYTESAAAAKHSPILAWAADGLPIYGPFGYSSPLDSASALRRMVSGFAMRNGGNGTTNLTATGRTTLPAWAARVQGRAAALATNQYGPNVNATYALGHYLEDYDYLGDLGQTQGPPGTGAFDLNEQNVRFCVTPEFPAGTWAYFTTIATNGTPLYPFNMGRQFFGTASGGEVASITETVTTHFQGGPNKVETINTPTTSATNVTVSWSVVEGGTYQVEGRTSLTTGTWGVLTPTLVATDDAAFYTENGALSSFASRFYRAIRASLATFDTNGFSYTGGGGGGTSVAPGGSAARGTTVTVTITLPTTPPNPPAGVLPVSVMLAGTIAGTSVTHPAANTVIATFAIPAGAPTGAQNIAVNFSVTPPPPNYTMTGAFTIN